MAISIQSRPHPTPSPKRFSGNVRTALLIVFSACSIAALPSCRPQAESGAPAKPGTERQELERRLKLSPERFGVIKIDDALVMAFDANKDCDGGYCTCTGDTDCNEMFSGVCASPSTDGICQIRGDVPKCRCKDPR